MTEETKEESPDHFSPDWSDHVMTYFEENELEEGYPKLNGLRRVAQVLFGRVRLCTSEVKVATPEFACVCVTISIGDDLENSVWSGCADASPNNTDKTFGKYPTAIAESRAEARAYRKLLGLSVCSFEELGAEAKSESLPDQPEKITGSQIAMIDRLAKKLDVKVVLTKESSYNEARELCKQLNTYQNKKELITEEMRGYKEEWKS